VSAEWGGIHDKNKTTENRALRNTTGRNILKDNPEKANNTKYSKTKLAWFSRFLRHSVGLFYNAHEPTMGQTLVIGRHKNTHTEM